MEYVGATQYRLSPCLEIWGLWYEVFDTNPLLKLHFAKHFIWIFYPFRWCQEESSPVVEQNVYVCTEQDYVPTLGWSHDLPLDGQEAADSLH